MSHPLDTWGKVVTAPADESDLQRIRIEQAQTGFHIIVVQQSGVFDYWLEGEDEVLDYLRSMEVKWEGAPATGDNGGAPSDARGPTPSQESPPVTTAHRPARSELLRGLGAPDVETRRRSLHLLLKHPAEALPGLVGLLQDPNATTMARVWAAVGLRNIEPDEGRVVENALRQTMAAEDATLRWATLKTIGQLRLHGLAPLVAEFVNDFAPVRWTWDEATPADAANAALREMAAPATVSDTTTFQWLPSAILPVAATPFVALLWDHGTVSDVGLEELASRVAAARCVYAVCGGERAQRLESLIDVAHVSRTLSGVDDAELLVTTAHKGESSSEVAWYFFSCAYRQVGEFKRVVCHVGGSEEQQSAVNAAIEASQFEAPEVE